VDQLLTPRGLVLTLASFGGVVLIRFDSGREVVVVVGVVFVWGGVFVLFVLLFFLCGNYLTLALFWGRFGVLEFVVR
jgi:hypothetical protein